MNGYKLIVIDKEGFKFEVPASSLEEARKMEDELSIKYHVQIRRVYENS